MHATPSHRPPLAAALLALSAALAGFAVQAAPEPGAAERNRREVAACRDTATPQNRAACLEDAMVAYREARRGVLGDGMTVDPANLTKRCEALKAADKDDCLARMRGAGTTSGSVENGGIYRELVTRTTAPVADKAPADKATPEKTAP
jgi:hypothetical protein